MSNTKKNEILLETGTNELEIIEFTIGGRSFGINVAKVLEIMQMQEVTPIPNSNKNIEGVFKPRNHIITVVSLSSYLNLPDSSRPERDILVITNFNQAQIAFHVHTVEGIHRLSWESMEEPDRAIYNGHEGVAIGITNINNKLITILDFEKIMAEMDPVHSIKVSDVQEKENQGQGEYPLIIAEDSQFLQELIKNCLRAAGYTNISAYSNGYDAWKALERIKEEGRVTDKVACVITDIEMPKMDGHTLTKMIKQDPMLKNIPVVIFSSLINNAMLKKGESVGANAQITKPDINRLIDYLNHYFLPQAGAKQQ